MDFLKRPYPLDSLSHNLRMTAVISVFVVLFLVYFQPFGFSALPYPQRLLISFGFGLVTLVTTPLLFFLFRYLLPKFLNEEHWNVRNEIFMVIINFCMIGMGNFLYATVIGIMRFNLYNFLSMLASTVIIGVFPVTIFVLLNQVRLLKKNLVLARDMNQAIQDKKESPFYPQEKQITLTAENEKDEFSFFLEQLLFIESTGNYITIYLKNGNNEIRKQLFRSSLSRTEKYLPETETLFRCHRTYLVNLKKITEVIGNTQGYKLHFNGIERLIPVARSQSKSFRRRLALKNKE